MPYQAKHRFARIAPRKARLVLDLVRGRDVDDALAMLRFSMTRAGVVMSFRLERSSGHRALDQETLDLIQRAQPLPALPPEVAQEVIELVVRVRFELR